MPQLDFQNTLTVSQVVWMAIIFATLYLLLSRWALPQVAVVLDDRAARIGADIESARQAKASADLAFAEIQEATRHAATEAQAAIATAIAAAKAEAAEQARVSNDRLDAQLATAERRIGEARTAAMGALRSVATETAAAVVARLTGREPSHAAVDRTVGAIMTERS